MKQETITSIKLIASNGMVLTNGETYGREVYLGTGDSVNNWYEITEEEYNELMPKVECTEEDWYEITEEEYEKIQAEIIEGE